MTQSGTTKKKSVTTAREGPYHHGDLRNALVHAAAALAEKGGPEAVTVRAAARHVGVTPTAAYRHFTNHGELLAAAHEQAQRNLYEAITEALAGVGPDADAGARLRAAGRGYIGFALREPGLFRTAFCGPETHDDSGYLDAPTFVLLSSLLDELVATGYTDPACRDGAEFGAWAAVHGMAALLIEEAMGPLDAATHEMVIGNVLDMVMRSLATGPRAGARRPDPA